MTFRCWIGRHDWLRITYHHRSTWQDQREYGGHYYRCADCWVRPRRHPRRARSGGTIETGWDPGDLVLREWPRKSPFADEEVAG